MPPIPAWPSNLGQTTYHYLCWRCGVRVAPTKERRTCLDCRWVVRTDPIYHMEEQS